MAKALSADAVENAGSGHPGSPVSLAPIAYTLYQHFIKHDPNDPNWEGRDRFILSGGHASLTQYVQLYFSGYGLTLDDLKHFRGGADTRTPGHPEYGLTPGIEMTTGPLGQGFASAIGFAYGERFQRGLLDPETPKEDSPFYHKIWAICGEGDIEEGISGEAAALAANQKLGNITVIFDANRIQIEGDTNLVHRRVQLHPARRLLQGGRRGSGRRYRQGRGRCSGSAEAHQGRHPDCLADPGQDQRSVLSRLQAGRRGRCRPQGSPRL